MGAKKKPDRAPVTEASAPDDAELLDSILHRTAKRPKVTEPTPTHLLWWAPTGKAARARTGFDPDYGDDAMVFYNEAALKDVLEEAVADGDAGRIRVFDMATGKVMRFSMKLVEEVVGADDWGG